MADVIISNDPDSEKSNTNELIYIASILCDTINLIEPKLCLFFANDLEVRFLINMKNRWVGRFWEIEKQLRG